MKHLVTLILIFIPFISVSQTKIHMIEENGIYKIPCEVNGLRMKFIFDTGASNVCLSLNEAKFMLENDYITNDDILGTSKTQIADGSIVENTVIILREIKISNLVLKDVKATVTHSLKAPLLLGQSAIQKLGAIQIQGNELIILEHQNSKSYSEISRLFEEAQSSFDNNLYAVAEKKYQELYDLEQLSDYGIYRLARSCYHNGNHEKAILYFNNIKDLTAFTNSEKHVLYSCLGWCYLVLKDYDNAKYNFEYLSKYEEDNYIEYGSKHSMALLYQFKGDYYKSYKLFEELLMKHVERKGGDKFVNLWKDRKIEDDITDRYMYECSYCLYLHHNYSKTYLLQIFTLAQNGNKYAIDFIRDNNLEEAYNTGIIN